MAKAPAPAERAARLRGHRPPRELFARRRRTQRDAGGAEPPGRRPRILPRRAAVQPQCPLDLADAGRRGALSRPQRRVPPDPPVRGTPARHVRRPDPGGQRAARLHRQMAGAAPASFPVEPARPRRPHLRDPVVRELRRRRRRCRDPQRDRPVSGTMGAQVPRHRDAARRRPAPDRPVRAAEHARPISSASRSSTTTRSAACSACRPGSTG